VIPSPPPLTAPQCLFPTSRVRLSHTSALPPLLLTRQASGSPPAPERATLDSSPSGTGQPLASLRATRMPPWTSWAAMPSAPWIRSTPWHLGLPPCSSTPCPPAPTPLAATPSVSPPRARRSVLELRFSALRRRPLQDCGWPRGSLRGRVRLHWLALDRCDFSGAGSVDPSVFFSPVETHSGPLGAPFPFGASQFAPLVLQPALPPNAFLDPVRTAALAPRAVPQQRAAAPLSSAPGALWRCPSGVWQRPQAVPLAPQSGAPAASSSTPEQCTHHPRAVRQQLAAAHRRGAPAACSSTLERCPWRPRAVP
jgi:hypothetical protein